MKSQDIPQFGISRINNLDNATAQEVFSTMFASAELGAAFSSQLPFTDCDESFLALYHLHQTAEPQVLLAGVQAHPPIGANVEQGSLSQAEQAQAREDIACLRQICNLNETYMRKFGYVFLIRAAGRSSQEILEDLQHRLQLSPQSEWEITCRNYWEINCLRLAQFLGMSQAQAEQIAAELADAHLV